MATYAVINPATGETLATYPDATAEDIERALASAQKTYTEWSRTTTVAERAALAQRAAELFEERKDELAAIINREMGKPLDQSIGEVEFSGGIVGAFAQNAEKWLADEVLEVEDGLKSFIRKQGIGVILGIMPWNYPTTKWPASRRRTSSSATPSCSSTPISARSRRWRWRRSSATQASPRAPTSTSSPPTSRSPPSSPMSACRASPSPVPSGPVPSLRSRPVAH